MQPGARCAGTTATNATSASYTGDLPDTEAYPEDELPRWPRQVLEKLGAFQALLADAWWARGPHDKSNWIVPGCVLVGGWPFRLPKGRGSQGESPEEGLAKLHSILDAGINTFVSLTEEAEIRGKAYCFNSFQKAAEGRYRELHGPQRQARRVGLELRFLSCPMVDGGTCEDEKLLQLLLCILAELRASRAVYIHCYGGHGRTGIVACSMLCLLWQFAPTEAVEIFNRLHSHRVECGVGGPGQFPHSDAQLRQVERMSCRRARFQAFLPPPDLPAPRRSESGEQDIQDPSLPKALPQPTQAGGDKKKLGKASKVMGGDLSVLAGTISDSSRIQGWACRGFGAILSAPLDTM